MQCSHAHYADGHCAQMECLNYFSKCPRHAASGRDDALCSLDVFREGDRVTLMFSTGEDDFPEESGTVRGRSGKHTYIVEVDGHPQSEDGLVEVHYEQMEATP